MSDKYQTREERRQQLEASKSNNKGNKKLNNKGLLKRIFLILIAIGIVTMLAGVATFAYMVKDAPKLNESLLKDPISSEILDQNGKLITKIGSEKRDYVDYENIPKLVEGAVLATEDARFYKHNGVDPIRLAGAVVANVKEGFGAEGASTITQQVVKNVFLSPDKTLSRKAQEAWLSLQLERKYTKQEIFEMYVNKIYMSDGVSGILTASKYYFNKDLNELELHEAALLAGMPQSPNNYNPFEYPEKAEKRRNVVLSLMNQHGYISEEEMKNAQSIPVSSSLVKKTDRETRDLPYDTFISQVIKEIEKKYPDINVHSDGLKIYTTLDTKAQDYVEEIMYGNEIISFPDEEFQAGITLLDTKTGEIRAIGGDRDPEVKYGFNFATEQKRQPGSTIKPILDYGPAIEYLKWGTYETLSDSPTTYSDGTPINNWDNSHLGSMSMREALARSRNIPALKALQEVGLDKAQDFAVNLGIPLNDIYESYAVGGLKDGVSTLEMAGAYSAFGNEGFYTDPHSVKKIVLRDGTTLNMKPEQQVVMKDYTAFIITDMLKSVVNSSYGTGTLANIPGLPVAGKTGTTNYTQQERLDYNIPLGAVPDAWFVGYTTKYTAAVWTGYKDRKNYIVSNGVDQKIAQNIFKNVMANVSNNVETADFTVPDSVEKVAIEKGTYPARLASSYTPSSQIIYEYAVKGNQPSQVSQKYNKLTAPSNLSASYDETTNQINVSWSYEDNADTQFEVSAIIDGGAEQQLKVSKDKSLSIADPNPGSTYTFKVTAFNGSQTSDAVSATVKVPTIEEEPIEEEIEDETGNTEGEPIEDGTTNENPDNEAINNGRDEDEDGADLEEDNPDETTENETDLENQNNGNNNGNDNNGNNTDGTNSSGNNDQTTNAEGNEE